MFLKLFKNAMIKNIKYIIFFILSKFQNLLNLKNVLKNNDENVHLNVSYDFSKVNRLRKIKM